ncbi:hypothetical protein [Luethyella okanaganae]|uniref:Uncharacterized protein n=1 Tax=Luethyella okanaganae TaxID=69372 RepID=A0ABW1VI45_9MICO
MADQQITSEAGLDTRRTWYLGGALLLGSVVVSASARPVESLLVGWSFVGTAMYSASLLVFAIGLRGAGSVTARRPLGTAAMTALAVWIAVSAIIGVFFSPDLTFGYGDALAQFIFALVAVVQIGRAGVVPAPWAWAPAWALGAVSLLWVLQQVGSGIVSPETLPPIVALAMLDGIVRVGSAVGLGALALVLADRGRR